MRRPGSGRCRWRRCWPSRGPFINCACGRSGRAFSLVLEERARLAREIHDTLAQGFVGTLFAIGRGGHVHARKSKSPARKYLDMARRMARHSLTEARRSVMDLRASVLEGRILAAALEAGMRMWTAGAGVDVRWT